MPRTPATLVRHELVGLHAEVIGGSGPDAGPYAGLAGRVVAETTRTLGLADPDDAGRVRTVPKRAATFAFRLPDGTDVTVEGRRLEARPARRTEEAGGSIWHSD